MTLLLTNETMAALALHPADAVEALEAALRDAAEQRAPVPPRARLYLPAEPGEPTFWVNNLMGAAPSSRTAAVRLDASFSRFVTAPEGAYSVREGDFSGLVLLWDLETAELKAILHDHYLSTRRVAATSAIGVRHLARPDARVCALFGTGRQAEQHLLALCAVRPIEEVRVYSRDPARRRAFAERWAAEVDARLVVVDAPADAVRGADIVCTATSARSPVFDGALLEPGMHLVTIVGSDQHAPGTEIDETAVRRADRIVTNHRRQIAVDEQRKLYPLLQRGALAWEDVAELSELVSGAVDGRRDAAELTLHDNNTGLGLQFAAVGQLVYERARKEGLGVELDTELFMTRGGHYAP